MRDKDSKSLDEIRGKVREILSSMRFDPQVAASAFHQDRSAMNDVLSGDDFTIGIGKGKFLENYVYEYWKRVVDNIDFVKYIVMKGRDVPIRKRKSTHNGKDGFFSNLNGQIVFRGNGQDLAEFDIVIVTNNNSVILVEVTNSKVNLNGLAQEIDRKEAIMESILGMKPVTFFTSPEDLSNKQAIRELERNPNDEFVQLKGMPELTLELIKEAAEVRYKQNHFPKLGLVENLPIEAEFSYGELLRKSSRKIIDFIDRGKTLHYVKNNVNLGFLSNLYLFSFKGKGLGRLAGMLGFNISGNKLTDEKIISNISEAIIGLSLPTFKPTVYLKLKSGKIYLKFTQLDFTDLEYGGVIPHSPKSHVSTSFIVAPEIVNDPERKFRLTLRFLKTFFTSENVALRRGRFLRLKYLKKVCPDLLEEN